MILRVLLLSGLGVGHASPRRCSLLVDILDADHQAGLAGDRGPVGQPAGASAHGLGDEVGPGGLGVGEQVADLAGQCLDGREVAESEVDALVVVVDRLGNVDDGDARLVSETGVPGTA